MTRDEVVAFGKKRYGETYVAALAKDIGFARSSVLRVVTGETPAVSPRMELAMEKLIRKHRFEALARPGVGYE